MTFAKTAEEFYANRPLGDRWSDAELEEQLAHCVSQGEGAAMQIFAMLRADPYTDDSEDFREHFAMVREYAMRAAAVQKEISRRFNATDL